MLNPKKIKQQNREVQDRLEDFEEFEDDFYLADRRFEKAFIFNGILALVLLGVAFHGATTEMDEQVLAIFFGMSCLQLVLGVAFAALLLFKRALAKFQFMLGVAIHGVGVAVVMLLNLFQ